MRKNAIKFAAMTTRKNVARRIAYDDYRYGPRYGYGPRYYGYGRHYASPCRPGWTVQGGVCKP